VAELVSFTEELTTSDQDSDNEFHSDTLYLNTVSEQQADTKNVWNVQVTIVNKVLFKVDTGAEVTVISDSAWESLQNVAGKLTQSKQRLCGPDHQPLKVLGTVNLTLSLNGKSGTQRVFIVKNLRNSLLGLPAIIQLQLLSQVDVVQKSIPDKFPELFTGLGSMKEPYTIKIKSDAKPHSLYTSRNVPLPLRAKVQKEFKRI